MQSPISCLLLIYFISFDLSLGYKPNELVTSSSFTDLEQRPASKKVIQEYQENQAISTSTTGQANFDIRNDALNQIKQNDYYEQPNTRLDSYDNGNQTSSPSVSIIQQTNSDFFSSSEKLPNLERPPNTWWALGFGINYEYASNVTKDDYLDFCSKSEVLVGNKQRALCRSHWRVMPIIARGLKLAIDECQFRFTSSRWNCSLAIENALQSSSDSTINIHGNDSLQFQNIGSQQPRPVPVFGEVMRQSNRERSFLNAIFAAGIAHAMTKACSAGELPEECGCDKRVRAKSQRAKGVEWVACSDDLDFGSRFSRDFTDGTETLQAYDDPSEESKAMINIHNYEVGRRIFKSSFDITCSCPNQMVITNADQSIYSHPQIQAAQTNHNQIKSSLCPTKRCWKHLSQFTDIGDELIRRYERATHVQPSNKDPHKLKPVRRGVRRPKRKDLVFIDESPDYCEQDSRLGILGTQGRHCNSTSQGPDSCSLLCCGRGYQVVQEEIEENCNCQFVYCCRVVCEKCKRQVTYDICN